MDASAVEIQEARSDTGPASLGTSRARSGQVHVLYLIDHVRQVIGGGEQALIKFIRYLPRDRFRVSVGTFKPNALQHVFEQLGCPLHVFPLDSMCSWNAARMAFRLRQLIRSERVDIVHTFFETANLWGGLVAKTGRNSPVLVSSRRDMGILRSAKHALAYRLMRPAFDSVLAVSERVRNHCIEQEGLAPEQVFVLYNGVELDRIAANQCTQAMRASLGLLSASHVITTVANVKRVKGLDVLVQAAARVRDQLPNAVFLVVGDFHEKLYTAELLQSIRQLGVYDNVRFVGGRDDIFPVLRASDLFFLPSRSEGFSNALIEAMACELPSVVTDVGGNHEALEDGRSGFVIPPDDAGAAADRILRLLRDPDLSRTMGAAARRTVESRFSAEMMGHRLSEFYERLLSTKRSLSSSV